jgi:hypothetical protein
MSVRPKTIQIFLPQGDPGGIRIAELTTRIMQVLEVPRHCLSTFLEMPEAERVAVYYLCGLTLEDAVPTVYIGQTGDLKHRLKAHEKKKELWDKALVVVSRTDSLTQTHAQFLEWQSIQQCRKVARFADQNGNSGSRPYTPAPLEADCLEIFETIELLTTTLGVPLFAEMARPVHQQFETFFCNRSSAKGRGHYSQGSFVVHKGSSGRGMSVESTKGTWIEQMRQKLLETGVARLDGDRLMFESEYTFSSPSGAAAILMGRSANGWVEWTTDDGRSLDSVVRHA